MIKNQQYSQLLQKLFNPFQNSLKIDLGILKQICSSQDHKRLIDLTGILSKLFLTGRQHLSIRQLVGQSLYPSLNDKLSAPQKQNKVDFFVDGLSGQQLSVMIRQLQQVRKRLQYTIYSSKLAQILEMLRKVLHQVRAQPQKKEEAMIVGDIQIMEEEYKKAQTGSVFQANAQSKVNDFLKSPRPHFEGKFSNASTLLRFMGSQILPHLARNVLSIPQINHPQRQAQLMKALQFIHQYFIVQYQIEIEISKNTLVQTRIYNNKFQRELLFRFRKVIIKAARELFNEAILTPSSIPIQILLLRILRRLYNLWDYTSAHSSQHLESIQDYQESQERSAANVVRNPIFLVLRNIALFSQGKEEELKEAAMFAYKVIQDKNDIQLVNLLENCEELRFLKNSKFYSSKAYTFADQIEKIYDPVELGSLHIKLYQCIPARQIWGYTFLIEKPSSLICWQFYLLGYDIRFGIFKLDHLKDLTLQQYQKGVECRQVLKMQKIQNPQSNPLKGHLYLKSGVYRLIFDNSFSMMRSKEICYTFLHLQSQG